jgi:hypothetical protein
VFIQYYWIVERLDEPTPGPLSVLPPRTHNLVTRCEKYCLDLPCLSPAKYLLSGLSRNLVCISLAMLA